MGKYDTWSITCKLCDWQWETCSRVMAQNPKCRICGSADCIVEKSELITIKKQGKTITEIGYEPLHDDIGIINGENLEKKSNFEKPLLIVRDNDFKFTEELTNDERKTLLGKMELIKTKIIRDIIDDLEQNTDE